MIIRDFVRDKWKIKNNLSTKNTKNTKKELLIAFIFDFRVFRGKNLFIFSRGDV
jgi:hypothetical protein